MDILRSSKTITTFLTLGGLIFELGRHSHKIDSIFPKIYALEKESQYIKKTVSDINVKLSTIEEKVINVDKEVTYIRNKMD